MYELRSLRVLLTVTTVSFHEATPKGIRSNNTVHPFSINGGRSQYSELLFSFLLYFQSALSINTTLVTQIAKSPFCERSNVIRFLRPAKNPFCVSRQLTATHSLFGENRFDTPTIVKKNIYVMLGVVYLTVSLAVGNTPDFNFRF